MSKQLRKPNQSGPASSEDSFLLETPDKAAQQLDALLYFIHRRYTRSSSTAIPHLGKFLITRAEVIFTNKLRSIQIQKRPERNVLQILAPPVDVDSEENRRIYLLNEFSDLILKYQKQAYLQIRDMVLRITDSEGHEALVKDFERYKATEKKR
ncbi:hypothetical protein [Bdellovibrio sp. HCB209]|uniref:hypothetical protein n=1 Tax=Bdellovibrio sp. HCB209 TaxID=3394354 RepID=UPI0039B62FE0